MLPHRLELQGFFTAVKFSPRPCPARWGGFQDWVTGELGGPCPPANALGPPANALGPPANTLGPPANTLGKKVAGAKAVGPSMDSTFVLYNVLNRKGVACCIRLWAMVASCRIAPDWRIRHFSPTWSWTEDRMGVSQRAGCREIVLCIPPVLRDFGRLWKTCAKSWTFPYNHFTINTLHGCSCSEKPPPAAARRGKLDRILLQALTCTTLQRPEKLARDRNPTVTIPRFRSALSSRWLLATRS